VRLAAARSRDPYLSAQYWRLARRIGKQKAAIAVGTQVLVIAWHLLTDNRDYQDLVATTSSGATPTASGNGPSPSSKPSATAPSSNPRRVTPWIHVSGRDPRFKSSQAHHTRSRAIRPRTSSHE
jgi:hypothetical protein